MSNPRIQLRHDTAENWSTANPILLNGEVGIEKGTGTASQLPVPTMTSESTDGWWAGCNGYDAQWSSDWYTVFSGGTWYYGNTFSNPNEVCLMFPETYTISGISIKQNSTDNSIAQNGYISITQNAEPSTATWTQVKTFTMDTTLDSVTTIVLDTPTTCHGVKLSFTNQASSSYPTNGVAVQDIKFYSETKTATHLKIGDGETAWNDLPYII